MVVVVTTVGASADDTLETQLTNQLSLAKDISERERILVENHRSYVKRTDL